MVAFLRDRVKNLRLSGKECFSIAMTSPRDWKKTYVEIATEKYSSYFDPISGCISLSISWKMGLWFSLSIEYWMSFIWWSVWRNRPWLGGINGQWTMCYYTVSIGLDNVFWIPNTSTWIYECPCWVAISWGKQSFTNRFQVL